MANANNNDIDALLDYLKLIQPYPRWADSLTALVAERNALKQERDELAARCKAQHEVMTDMVGEERNADRERDLRERLVCAALTGLMAQPAHGSRESWANIAVSFADATLAAMRKEQKNA